MQAVCSISSAIFREHTQPVMISLKMLNVNQIYIYMSCNYVFKVLNGLNTCDCFSRYHNVYSTRSTEDITLNFPFAHSWQSMSFLRISAAVVWNMLPGSLRERRSYSGFNFALMSFIGFFSCILRTPYISHM